MRKPQTSTYGDIQKLVEQLKAENDPSNDELIAFYTERLKTAAIKYFDRIDKRKRNWRLVKA